MKHKPFYFLSLLTVIILSAYPLYMGITTLSAYMKIGVVPSGDYKKYIIPYTPICLAILICVALMPLFFRLLKKYAFAGSSLLGILLFLVFELGFEQIKILEGTAEMPLESWQLSLCIATPEVLRTLGEPIFAQANPTFKIHFYIIALLIILAVLNVIYGFYRMLLTRDFSRKRTLTAQAVSTALFICLCVLACFTAFYRNGTLNLSPISAVLMSVFFIVFGTTAGIYCGSLLTGKHIFLSIYLPAIVASLTTLIMYIGELVLMGGVLFRYGKGFFFEPALATPFSLADIFIIIASGVLAYGVVKKLAIKK